MEIQVLDDVGALAETAARLFMESAGTAIAQRGRFSVALAGGSTPLRLYDLLAWDPFASGIDWKRTHLFWGDERCVSPAHIDSNFQQAQVQLLSKLEVPARNIHRIHAEIGANQAADLYQEELRHFFGKDPVFDLILLGIGPDGHIASLFPGTAALEETRRWVVGVPHSTPPPPLVDRVSLTLPVINAAHLVMFLVAGAGKAQIMEQVTASHQEGTLLPAQRVNPLQGRMIWLVEKSALGK